MTQERAKYLLSKMRNGEIPMAYKPAYSVNDQFTPDPNGLTQAEDDFVKERTTRYSFWMNSLFSIANGL